MFETLWIASVPHHSFTRKGIAMSTLETFPSGTKSISVEVSTPTTPGKHPAVLVVYGTDGLTDDHGFGTAVRPSPPDWPAKGSSR